MSADNLERRRGPSTSTLAFGGIIAIASLLAAGVSTYNSVQNDIASLKRADVYQERSNERLANEIGRISKTAIDDFSCEMVKK